jgi:hypothetical protein
MLPRDFFIIKNLIKNFSSCPKYLHLSATDQTTSNYFIYFAANCRDLLQKVARHQKIYPKNEQNAR